MRCTRAACAIRCCNLALFRVRTFSAAVSGSFVTRLGIGGVPFLLPLLYQVGLGYSPIAVGIADHAASARGAQHEILSARNSRPRRLSGRA